MTKRNQSLCLPDLLQQVYDKISVHIYFKNINFEYIACNPLQAKDAGFSTPHEIIGKTDYDLFPKILADQIRRNDEEVLHSGKACVFDENFFDLSQNDPIYLTHKIPIYNENKELIGLAGISLNITARKIKEEEAELARETAEITLASILENLPGHVYWKNKDSVYQGCNLAQAKSAGFSSVAEMIGKTDNETPWHHEAAILRKSDLMVMDSKTTLTREEASRLSDSDHVSIFLSKKAPLFNAEKEVIGVLGISFDITDRKEMEKKLKLAKESAEAANKAKSEFLENMRHDIRTPLTGIVGFADIIKMESDNALIKEYSENLVASSHALLDLLDEVLEAIRVSSGEIPKLKKKFNIENTLKHIIELNRAKAAQKKLSLTLNFDSSIPRYVIGDKVRIHRLVLELIANALNFTDYGFVKLSASLAKCHKNKLVLKIMIEDSGIGIPKDKQDDIYLQFKRLTPSYQGIYKGAGLGLAVVKQFIDELDGEIYVESEVRKGACFTCLIPLKKPLTEDDLGVDNTLEENQDKPYETTYAQEITPSLRLEESNHKFSVLVVEDNSIAQTVAKSILGKLHCHADIAGTGDAAVKLWKANQYDLIFMDIGLPDMDGYEITHQIRVQELAKKTLVPIIALTAHAGDENKKRCIEAGMNAVLTKPLTAKSCIDILEAFVSDYPQTQELNKVQQNTYASDLPDIEESLFDLSAFPILDKAEGIKTTGTEEVLAEMLIIMLKESLPEDLALMQEAYEANDWEKTQKLAHKIKGGAVYVGTTRMKMACQYLERYWKTGQRDLLEPLYQQALAAIDETLQEIEDWLKERQP